MIKTLLKSKISPEKWADLRSQKRYFLTLFQHSDFDVSLKYVKKIMIIGVADYMNLGDHAIGQAQRLFLDKIVGIDDEYQIVEVPSRTPIRFIEEIIGDDDILLFTGGGNLGTKYGFLHDIYLPIIDKHSDLQKLFFPQSYTFNETGDSEKLMNHIKAVFSRSGKNLTITARESKSYARFQEVFPENNIIFTPDIVLSLDNRDEKKVHGEGILMLMRDEGEKVLDLETQEVLTKALAKKFKVTAHVNDNSYDVKPEDRLRELNIKWDEIKSSELVITDRLHGMIFAQTSGIPCIVFDNYNSKIKMTVNDWLSDMDNIVFIDPREEIDIDEFVKLSSNLCGQSVEKFNIEEKYAPLIAKLVEMVKEDKLIKE